MVDQAMVEQLIETEYDNVLSAGRNRLFDAGVTTPQAGAEDETSIHKKSSPLRTMSISELCRKVFLN